MIKLFILVTPRVQQELNNTLIRPITRFGTQRFTPKESDPVEGVVVLLQGQQQDFNKLLETVGELWMCSHPVLGNWVQYLLRSTETQG
jgi:hypothetical protein